MRKVDRRRKMHFWGKEQGLLTFLRKVGTEKFPKDG